MSNPASAPSPAPLHYLPEMPADKSPRIGCIGTGFIMSDCHLVAYRANGFNPDAIAARDRAKAAEVAARHNIPTVHDTIEALLADTSIEVLDIALPPHKQLEVIQAACRQKHIKGILAQKPLGMNYAEALQAVEACEAAGIKLAVNQNMRYDQSIRALKDLLNQNALGEPILATIDMRAIPHWMPWQADYGWLTLRIMSIHHIDAFRFLFGDPIRIYASARTDPRTEPKFPHTDGICIYILEYANGLRCMACDDVWAGPAREGANPETHINWRVEGRLGTARGTIGWPKYPEPTPSTLDYTTIALGPDWHQPRWPEVWFPDAFAGPMAQLLIALEKNESPALSARDNLKTMALVDAAYQSLTEHRAIGLSEIYK